MSFVDKAKHKAEEVIGEVKEKVGELTGNEKLQAEGQKDQLSANVKQTGDSVKDAASNLGDKLKGDRS